MTGLLKDRPDITEAIWLLANAAIFAATTALWERTSYDFKIGLATALLVDIFCANNIIIIYSKFDFLNSALDLMFAVFLFCGYLVVYFHFLGEGFYSALSLIPLVKSGGDILAFARTPPTDDPASARKYISTFFKAYMPLAYIFAISFLVASRHFEYANTDIHCQTIVCRVINPPDLYLMFGMFYYAAVAAVTIYCRPEWLRWLPTPTYLRNR